MSEITFTCDRCGEEKTGLEFDNGTAGFYRSTKTWSEFMNKGEDIICDDCMWSDERYVAKLSQQRSGM